MKVIIIGAGPGGLTLAQCLRKAGVQYEIFESDESDDARAQGWALTLHWILPELLAAVPDDLSPLYETSVLHPRTDILPTITMNDAQTGERRMFRGDDPNEPGIRVNRTNFRNWLSKNIAINWGKKFSKYTQNSDGSVTAHFSDGSEATGDVLVGADGVYSKVRSQLIPDAPPPTLGPIGIIIGQVELPMEVSEELRSQLGQVVTMASATPKGLRVFFGLQRFNLEKNTAKHYWIVSYYEPGAPEYLKTLSGEELLQFAKDKTKDAGVQDKFIAGMAYTKPEDVAPRSMHYWIPPTELPTGRVTLLGDSAHGILPFKGEGANVAIRDAVQLAHALVSGKLVKSHLRIAERPDDIDGWIKEYVPAMLKRGKAATEESVEAMMLVHGQAGEQQLRELEKGLMKKRTD